MIVLINNWNPNFKVLQILTNIQFFDLDLAESDHQIKFCVNFHPVKW